MLPTVALRCLLVDDSAHFLEAASRLLARQGLVVVGTATTGDEALRRARELAPDVAIVDLNLSGESGFDLAWQLASISPDAPIRTILTSTHAEADLAELVAVTPVLGFISKNEFSATAVQDFVADRNHGHGCRHEALVYSSANELATATVPFLQQGLARGERVLVVLREAGRAVLRAALGSDAGRIEFGDAVPWYRSPEHAFQQYTDYLGTQFAQGAPRVRVVAEVVWPDGLPAADVAAWKRYEAGISGAMASVPVSFICAYNSRELPTQIITAARRTHPVLRTQDGAVPNTRYSQPGSFLRDLEAELAPGR